MGDSKRHRREGEGWEALGPLGLPASPTPSLDSRPWLLSERSFYKAVFLLLWLIPSNGSLLLAHLQDTVYFTCPHLINSPFPYMFFKLLNLSVKLVFFEDTDAYRYVLWSLWCHWQNGDKKSFTCTRGTAHGGALTSVYFLFPEWPILEAHLHICSHEPSVMHRALPMQSVSRNVLVCLCW